MTNSIKGHCSIWVYEVQTKVVPQNVPQMNAKIMILVEIDYFFQNLHCLFLFFCK